MQNNISDGTAQVLQTVFPSIKSYNLGDGWNNTMGFTFSVNDDEYHLNCFLELEDLAYALIDNLKTLDLNAGADDQFFDYSPDQLSGIMQAFSQLIGHYDDDYTEELTKVHDCLVSYFNMDHNGCHDNDDEYQKALEQINQWLNNQ